ncbi:hypothetical protein TrCOL_g3264 [Triparma columacea]|uniref:Uncharacterized protein n=1 Tax=Triparma columacea TaxID=722753 RepID=A0A9W7G4U3_9STRA|nr:hypothetical protein TrCOL_g3264 [Triparma columacea]
MSEPEGSLASIRAAFLSLRKLAPAEVMDVKKYDYDSYNHSSSDDEYSDSDTEILERITFNATFTVSGSVGEESSEDYERFLRQAVFPGRNVRDINRASSKWREFVGDAVRRAEGVREALRIMEKKKGGNKKGEERGE